MAGWEQAEWQSAIESGAPRPDRRSGTYLRYVPSPLERLHIGISRELSLQVAAVERRIRALDGPGADGLAGIARFLLRSEAIASSRIEGIAPSPQQVALAELGRTESVRGVSEQATLVANNMTIVREATSELVRADEVTVHQLVELHRSLLPAEPQHQGLRSVQNWIGHSSWSPIGADYVPPDPARVPPLMEDLVAHLNGAAHSALIQAALVHAQFETIHPFTDGNGRVGRALIHTVLARRGLTRTAVLPVSLVLATIRERYVGGLTAFRHTEPDGSPGSDEAINAWLSVFVSAADAAAAQAESLARQIDKLRAYWVERLTAHRAGLGIRTNPRADSTVARLLDQLPEAPVVTPTSLARILAVSLPAASSALNELHAAGILATKAVDRGATAYIAREILDLVTWSERALASTQFDTRAAPPNRSAPAAPQA